MRVSIVCFGLLRARTGAHVEFAPRTDQLQAPWRGCTIVSSRSGTTSPRRSDQVLAQRGIGAWLIDERRHHPGQPLRILEAVSFHQVLTLGGHHPLRAQEIDWPALEADLAGLDEGHVVRLVAGIPQELGSAEQNNRRAIYSRLEPFLLRRLQVLPELIENLRTFVEKKQ
jgi:hypothetical protein